MIEWPAKEEYPNNQPLTARSNGYIEGWNSCHFAFIKIIESMPNLVELDVDKVVKFLDDYYIKSPLCFDMGQHECMDLASEICSRFGTKEQTEKVELDEPYISLRLQMETGLSVKTCDLVTTVVSKYINTSIPKQRELPSIDNIEKIIYEWFKTPGLSKALMAEKSEAMINLITVLATAIRNLLEGGKG